MKQNKKIGVAVIGSGRAGMIHARNYYRGINGSQLIAIVDPIEEVAKKCAEELSLDTYYTDYKEALKNDDINAVVIVTPTKYHAEIVCDAANAGKHIFCEKPMAMTEQECQQMIDACHKNNVVLQLGFMRRFDKNFMEAKAAIEAGAIGKVVLVKALTHGPSVPQEWMYDISISAGPLGEVCSHDIDAVRWFTGSDFDEVYAVAGNFRCPQATEKYPDYYDTVTMNGRMKSGAQFVVEGAVSVGYGYDSRVEILGTDGVLFVGDLHANNVVYANRHNKQLVSDTVSSWMKLFIDAYETEDQAFINSIVSGEAPKASGYDGLQTVKAVNAGNLSISRNSIIKLG